MIGPIKLSDAKSVRLTNELEKTLHRSLAEANRRQHEYTTLEHLLYALLNDLDAVDLLIGCSVNTTILSENLQKYLDTPKNFLIVMNGAETSPTASFQRVVQRAILHAQSFGRSELNGANVLVALLSERESYAVNCLNHQNFSRVDALKFLSDRVKKGQPEDLGTIQTNNYPEVVDFFISYSSSDELSAREISAILRAAGYSTVSQFDSFGNGSNFVREMQSALSSSSRFISIYSPSYEKSDHCQAEWSAAYNQDPSGAKRKVVGFMVRPTALNPLARQIVYTSLIGLDGPGRARAVLDAVSYKKPIRSNREIAQEAARVSSPDVELRGGKLHPIPNRTSDASIKRKEVIQVSYVLCELAGLVIDVLPGNTPPVVLKCLLSYKRNLENNIRQPIIGFLSVAISAVEREYRGQDFELWGPGLDGLLQDLFRNHDILVSYFPKNSDRERLLSDIDVTDSTLVNGKIEDSVVEASKALAGIAAEGLTTPAFDQVVKDYREQAEQLSGQLENNPNHESLSGVSARRRLVIGTIGFYERVISVLGNFSKVADSPTVASAIGAVRHAIESLLKLLS